MITFLSGFTTVVNILRFRDGLSFRADFTLDMKGILTGSKYCDSFYMATVYRLIDYIRILLGERSCKIHVPKQVCLFWFNKRSCVLLGYLTANALQSFPNIPSLCRYK